MLIPNGIVVQIYGLDLNKNRTKTNHKIKENEKKISLHARLDSLAL